MRKVCDYALLRKLPAHEGLELFIKPSPLAFFLDPSLISYGATLWSGEAEPAMPFDPGEHWTLEAQEEEQLHTGAILWPK